MKSNARVGRDGLGHGDSRAEWLRVTIAVALGLAASWLVSEAMPLGVPGILLSIAVVSLAAWLGGPVPGAVATLVIAGRWLLTADPGTFGPDRERISSVAWFALEGLVIVALAALGRRAALGRTRAERRQAAVAELSRRCLGPEAIEFLLRDAAESMRGALGVDRVQIVELAAGRAGWSLAFPESATGRARPLTIATVPITNAEETIATLDIASARRRRLSRVELEFVQIVANLLSSCLRTRLAGSQNARMRAHDMLLADVTATLSASLDFLSRIESLAEMLVPRLADTCLIDIGDESGRLRRHARANAEAISATAVGVIEALPSPEHLQHPAMGAFHSGVSQRIVRLGESDLERLAGGSDELRERLRDLGIRSLLAVPLRARGRTLGVMTFLALTRAEFDASDLALAEEVAQRAALLLDNARLYEKLLAEDRAKDEFLAMLGHELRNPLAPIVHSIEVFRVASPDSEARERARRVLERQVMQLRHVVRDLLDVARVTRGTIELRREPVELIQAVSNAVESSQPLIQSHGHALKVHLPEEPVWIDADPVRLDQILTNLVQNAVEHARPQTRTDLTVEREGGQVAIRVKDNGIGIPPERLGRVFDLVSHDERLEIGPGSGIGLHLVRRLVELHGATIEAHSAGVDRGSEFVVRWPALPTAAPAKPVPAESTPSEAVGPLRVLVVDDHLDTANALSELLALWGYEAKAALDGREALRVVETFQPDLVLLDLAMPDMNGYQVAAAMKRMGALAGATLVALTGHAREQKREAAAGHPFDHHWIKPLDAGALRTFLEELSRHRHNALTS